MHSRTCTSIDSVQNVPSVTCSRWCQAQYWTATWQKLSYCHTCSRPSISEVSARLISGLWTHVQDGFSTSIPRDTLTMSAGGPCIVCMQTSIRHLQSLCQNGQKAGLRLRELASQEVGASEYSRVAYRVLLMMDTQVVAFIMIDVVDGCSVTLHEVCG